MPISKTIPAEVPYILSQFELPGPPEEIAFYGNGHINDTFSSKVRSGSSHTVRYIHQRINQYVFKNPVQVMENVERITKHLKEKIVSEKGDPNRETLTLIPCRNNKSFFEDDSGNFWRTFLLVENTQSFECPENPDQVAMASSAFGLFQKRLCDLGGNRLHETIPNFHNTPFRYRNLTESINKDAANRAASVASEIDFIIQRKRDTSILIDLLSQGSIPERITHNDTKLNNVLFDTVSGNALCVIDLDTVMPGSALYDFGDSVRIGASTAVEDEPNLEKVAMDINLFRYLATGYLETAQDFLTPQEIELLPFSAKLITLEQAIRFLSDYIDGDIYYKVHRNGQNLDRARTQIKMVRDMENKMEQMVAIVHERI